MGRISKWVWVRRDTRWDVYPCREPRFIVRAEISGPANYRSHEFFWKGGGKVRGGSLTVLRDAHPYEVDGEPPFPFDSSDPLDVAPTRRYTA